MVDFGGWDMPVLYSGIIDEHNAVRNAVGIFDVSHMGEIEVRGPEAGKLTDYVTTNAVHKLKLGQAHYSGLLYDHGGFVDDILVHKVADDHYFLCVNASNQDKDYEHIVANNRFDATVENAGPRYAQLAIQGPLATSVLRKLTGTDLAAIKRYHFVDGTVSGAPARIARTGYTGEDGFEVYVPSDEATSARVWNEILSAGKEFGAVPCGLGARNTLRLESKLPLYGHEISDTINVWEAGLDRFCKMDKPEFVGRDALESARAEGLKRTLVGLEMIERGIARDGYKVLNDTSSEIGYVTSGSYAPYLKKNIALAYVPPENAAIGRTVRVEIRGQGVKAQVVPTPFYKKPKKS